MTEKIMNFKVLLYSNVRNRQEESSTDRFVWFLPNAIPPAKINPQLISFLTSRDFSQKPLNFDERLRKFTLFEDKAQNSSPSAHPGPYTFYRMFLPSSVLELKTFFSFSDLHLLY